MNVRRHTKFVREGAYGAEVDVEIIDGGNSWSPYLSLDDARRLDASVKRCAGQTWRPHQDSPACSVSRPSVDKPVLLVRREKR